MNTHDTAAAAAVLTRLAAARVRCRFGAAALAVACLAAVTAAQAQSADPRRLAALEAAFWRCEARAMREALPPGDGAQCAVVTDRLKALAFGGDFERMLVWWRAHRRAALAALGVSVDGGDAAQNARADY
jgi:hypothetical protein